MIVDLTRTAWTGVPQGSLVVMPVGSIEQHGPHLPFHTDGLVAEAVATGMAAAVPDPVVVAPLMPYGSSGEHQAFAGTISIGADALAAVIIELVRSVATWGGRIAFVNGHGGNATVLARAVRRLRQEGHDVAWFACVIPGADPHAGDAETSVMLHLAPPLVDMTRAQAGLTVPIEVILPRLREVGVRPLSPSGVLGDSTTADAERGAVLIAGLVADAVAAVERWTPDADGRIR